MTEASFTQQVDSFQHAYHTLINLAENYPTSLQTQTGACGVWSAREVLAHINGWLVEAQRRFPRFAKGTGKMDYNIDAFNEVSVWLRDGKDFEQILAEMKTLVSKTVSIMGELPSAYIERDNRYGEWLETLTEQAENHSQQLQEFLEAQS